MWEPICCSAVLKKKKKTAVYKKRNNNNTEAENENWVPTKRQDKKHERK